MSPAQPRAAVALAATSLLLATVVLLALVGRPLATDDLWWHMKLGETYAAEGPWVDEDPLYHTTRNRPTVPHEWLFQVAVHGLDVAVGFQGLRVIHVLLVTAILVWAFRIFLRAGAGAAPAALATLVLLVLSWYRLFQFRPDLLSLLALLGCYVLLFEKEEPPSWRRLTAALALLVVWANVHSLVSIGLALIIAALLGVGLRQLLLRWLVPSGQKDLRDRRLAGALALALVLGFLVTGLNPRGLEQHATFFVESASGDIWHLRDDFLRWNPLWPADENRALTFLSWLVADALLLAFAATALLGLVRVVRERSAEAVRDLDCLHLGLGAASIVAMLVAVRFHWMAVFPLLTVLRRLGLEASRRKDLGRRLAWSSAAACLLLALGFPGGIRLVSYLQELAVEEEGYWKSPYLDRRYCGPGTRFLRDAELRGRMFHPFNMGGFLAYWLAPDLRTFIDGRMDHYPGEVLEDYLRIRRASQEGAPRQASELLDKWKVDVFFGTSFPESQYADRHWISHLRRLPGWVLVFAADDHSVYLRRTPRNERNFAKVKAYYLQRRLPFTIDGGLDVSKVIRRRPAWARRNRVVPAHFDALQELRLHPDQEKRKLALGELGRIYWQVGAFADAAEADRELLALEPGAKESRRRLADALLHLGRPDEAAAVADALYAEDPGYEDIAAIRRIARYRSARSQNENGADPLE